MPLVLVLKVSQPRVLRSQVEADSFRRQEGAEEEQVEGGPFVVSIGAPASQEVEVSAGALKSSQKDPYASTCDCWIQRMVKAMENAS
jgi:hypothetical protein